ncbi:MAG: hypothetical protein JNM56_33735 [Planctomycetia bacterium]|nr:hypothetical protein [Planctomycetia bacterium]
MSTLTPAPTWTELVALEPRLQALYDEAHALRVDDDPLFCGSFCYAIGHGEIPSFKRRIRELVGWYRPEDHPVLSTSAAWLLVSQTIEDALPDCGTGGCSCRADAAEWRRAFGLTSSL